MGEGGGGRGGGGGVRLHCGGRGVEGRNMIYFDKWGGMQGNCSRIILKKRGGGVCSGYELSNRYRGEENRRGEGGGGKGEGEVGR